MYFASRLQAGRMLAAKLAPKYRYENCAVLALNDASVMIGAQIARELHCVITLLLSEEIKLPREPDAIAGIAAGGTIAYNSRYSQGELDEMLGENRSFVEQEKMRHMHDMNALLGSGGTINRDLLKGHHIIVVSDGMQTGFALDIAYEFLKPIAIESLIVATPFASVPAVDRMHILADDIYCLDVIADYISTDHYYEKQDVPDHKTVVETLEKIILNWT